MQVVSFPLLFQFTLTQCVRLRGAGNYASFLINKMTRMKLLKNCSEDSFPQLLKRRCSVCARTLKTH